MEVPYVDWWIDDPYFESHKYIERPDDALSSLAILLRSFDSKGKGRVLLPAGMYKAHWLKNKC